MTNAKKRVKRIMAPFSPEQVSPEVLVEQGKAALGRGDASAAIRHWQGARYGLAGDGARAGQLTAALAEAYFRRGVTASPANLDDLAEAMRLQPDEPRFQYHLALAHQRRGEWQPAIGLYRVLLEHSPPYSRVAFPLAVALIAAGRQPRRDPVWQLLAADEQERILGAYALIRGQVARPRKGAGAFWTGLYAYRMRDPAAADLLQAALDDPTLPLRAAGIAHYYLGALAWQEQQRSQALAHWQAAEQAGLHWPGGEGQHTPWLLHNLANAYGQNAVSLLRAGERDEAETPTLRVAEVLRLAVLGLQFAPGDQRLRNIMNHARGHLGYRAALARDWATALEHLWAACAPHVGSTSQSGDRMRAVLTNAALASEAMKRFAQAAGLWQEIARRRSYKSGDLDALTTGQAARMWQRVAECYSRAGDQEEAARAYRNAIRNAPEYLPLQIGLVQALVNDERYAAALSAVAKILAGEPNNVEALAWQAQAFAQSDYVYAALRSWQRVLDLDPQHPTVHQSLGQLHGREGDSKRAGGDLRRAILAYRDGLKHAPADARLRASLGLCYGLQGNLEQARQELHGLASEQPPDAEAHYWVAWAWMVMGEWEETQGHLARAEMLEPPLPATFYVDVASWCVHNGRRRWTAQLLEMAEKHAQNDADALLNLADALKLDQQNERALGCLERALGLQPDRAEIHLLLGMYYLASGDDDDERVAEQYFVEAERLALLSGDDLTLLQVRVGRNLVRLGDGT